MESKAVLFFFSWLKIEAEEAQLVPKEHICKLHHFLGWCVVFMVCFQGVETGRSGL